VDYLKRFASKDFSATVSVSLQQKLLKKLELKGDDLFKPSIQVIKGAKGYIGKNQISIEKAGEGSVYYNASISFFGRQEKIAPKGDMFKVKRSYFRVVKERKADGWVLSTKPLLAPVHSGEEILVVLNVQFTKEADYLILEDPFPAGTQPIDRDRGYDIKGISLRQPQVHREFGDRHAAFFISHAGKGRMSFAYLLRATLPGDYNVMPARIMPMYDPQFAGNSSNISLRVED